LFNVHLLSAHSQTPPSASSTQRKFDNDNGHKVVTVPLTYNVSSNQLCPSIMHGSVG